MPPDISRAGPASGPDGDRLDRLLAERGDHLLHAAIALTGEPAGRRGPAASRDRTALAQAPARR